MHIKSSFSDKREAIFRMVYDLQKGSMWKRISAFLFDFIIMTVITVLFALMLSWATGYDGWQQSFSDAYRRVEDEYGVHLDLNYEEYKALTEEQNDRLTAAYDALREDGAAMKAYQMIRTLSQLIVSISILLGVLIWEFVIPLKLKDGRTLGKKIFGLALMRTDGVRVSTVSLFIRAFLGKYTIEIMIPVLIIMMIYWGAIGIIAPIILALILIVEIGVVTFTRTNSMIHDLLAGTVVVDYMSQMIFDTPEAMIAYKEKIAAEQALKEPY
jgi:uncharacterized RDD family membrane protein YckC